MAFKKENRQVVAAWEQAAFFLEKATFIFIPSQCGPSVLGPDAGAPRVHCGALWQCPGRLGPC